MVVVSRAVLLVLALMYKRYFILRDCYDIPQDYYYDEHATKVEHCQRSLDQR